MQALSLHLPLAGYDTTEEFICILVANIYISEMNKKFRQNQPLRGSHSHKFIPLDPSLTDSKNYYRAYKHTIDDFNAKMREFCDFLARIPVDFNPIREADPLYRGVPVYE